MMKIQVKSGIVANPHSSFGQAKGSSKKDIENHGNIREKKVSKVDYFPNNIFIYFDETDYYIHISIGDNQILCTITKESKLKLSNADYNKRQIPKKVKLDYSGVTLDWQSEIFFSKFIGKMIALSPNDQYLFVYVKDEADYICEYLLDKNNEYEPFLYLSEY